MAVATYNTDLQFVNEAEATTGWSEMTGRTSGGAATQEDRSYIQNTYCVSQSTGTATGKTAGLQYDYGSNITWTTGFVFVVWQYWQAPKAIDTWANGGMRFGVGSTAGNVDLWNAQGNDYGRNPYGGWTNVAIDPTYTYDERIGTPSAGAYRIFCSAPNMLSAVSKGNPHCVDAIRYGRGQIKVELGDSGGYGTFAGMANANDANTARWGLFSLQFGTYLWKGLMSIGTATNAVDFRDSTRTIVIDDTPRTYADFNKVEIRHASSRVDWSAITFLTLGTLSKGRLEVVDDCDVNITGCTFAGMDTLIFKAASDVLLSTILNCGIVTANGAKFNGTVFTGFTGAADASQLVWDTNTDLDGKIDGCSFTKGTNATHAIQLGTTSPTSVTIRNCTFSGYNASTGQQDSTILVSRTTGTVTINLVSCSGTVSYKSAGAIVNISADPVTALVNVKTLAGVNILGATVLLKTSATGAFPYNVTVTITNSGTTATVAHTSHGMVTNDKVLIKGASLQANNGVFSITKTSDNEYTYQMASSPGSSPTGTIKCWFVVLSGTTDTDGNISMSRVFSVDQPVSGWVRKSSAQPYYKEAALGGTVDSATGYTANVQMIPDE